MNCIQMGWPNPNWLVDWQKFQNPIYKDSLDPGSLLDNKKRGLIRDKSDFVKKMTKKFFWTENSLKIFWTKKYHVPKPGR